MGKTKRHEPRAGEFRKLKSAKGRNKKQRQEKKVELKRIIGLNRKSDMAQLNADIDIGAVPNAETIAAMEELENGNAKIFGTVEDMLDELNQ